MYFVTRADLFFGFELEECREMTMDIDEYYESLVKGFSYKDQLEIVYCMMGDYDRCVFIAIKESHRESDDMEPVSVDYVVSKGAEKKWASILLDLCYHLKRDSTVGWLLVSTGYSST